MKNLLFWVVMAALIVLSGCVLPPTIAQYETNPNYQSFVIRLYPANETVHPYWRVEYDLNDEPYTLDFEEVKIPLVSGRRVVYAMDKSDGPAAFKLHAEMGKNFAETKARYIQLQDTYMTDEFEFQKAEYRGHEIRLLRMKDVDKAASEYRGVIGYANVFFPEKNIVVTIYFFDTPYYGKPVPAMESIIQALIDHVETGYFN